jgi:hypothetical protein
MMPPLDRIKKSSPSMKNLLNAIRTIEINFEKTKVIKYCGAHIMLLATID